MYTLYKKTLSGHVRYKSSSFLREGVQQKNDLLGDMSPIDLLGGRGGGVRPPPAEKVSFFSDKM